MCRVVEQTVQHIGIFGKIIHRIEIVVDISGITEMEHQSIFIVLCQLHKIVDGPLHNGEGVDFIEISVQDVAAVDQDVIIKFHAVHDQLHLIQRPSGGGHDFVTRLAQLVNGCQGGFLNDVILCLVESAIHVDERNFMFHWLILLYVSMLCGVFSTNLCFLGFLGPFGCPSVTV